MKAIKKFFDFKKDVNKFKEEMAEIFLKIENLQVENKKLKAEINRYKTELKQVKQNVLKLEDENK